MRQSARIAPADPMGSSDADGPPGTSPPVGAGPVGEVACKAVRKIEAVSRAFNRPQSRGNFHSTFISGNGIIEDEMLDWITIASA
jgi:hypothetical protein